MADGNCVRVVVVYKSLSDMQILTPTTDDRQILRWFRVGGPGEQIIYLWLVITTRLAAAATTDIECAQLR